MTLVSARVCILGTEPDETAGGKLRFVLPPGDPCSCTEVVLGGHNAYAPPRKDHPVYIDTLPTDAEELRRLLGCMDINSQADEVSTEISQVDGTCRGLVLCLRCGYLSPNNGYNCVCVLHWPFAL